MKHKLIILCNIKTLFYLFSYEFVVEPIVAVRQLAPDSRREQLCGRLLRRFKTKTNTTYKFIWLQNDRVSKPCEFVYVCLKTGEVSEKNRADFKYYSILFVERSCLVIVFLYFFYLS